MARPYPERRPKNLIKLCNGRIVNLAFFQDTDVELADIAFSLSNQNRYTGHAPRNINVAEHSYWVCVYLQESYPENIMLHRQGLLHDATEAYLGDVASPLKKMLPSYHGLELKFWRHIAARFNVEPKMHKMVKVADRIAYATEVRDIWHDDPNSWPWHAGSPGEQKGFMKLQCWSPEVARMKFMEKALEIGLV